MRRFIVLPILLMLLVVPAARADEEVPVSWDRDPRSLQGYGRATGRAERPLTEWTALEVTASGPYTVCVQTVYGETMVDVRGATAGQLALSGSAPLRILYEGPPAQVRVLGRERRMAPRAAGGSGWPIRYETGDAVVPADTVVYGRVNRPYTIAVEPVGGPAQIYDLEVR